MAADLPEITIADPYIRQRVETIRQRRGISTLSRAAGQLILERATQLEAHEHPCPNCSSVSETDAGESVASEPQS